MAVSRRRVMQIAGGFMGIGVVAAAGGIGWLAWRSREAPLAYAFPDATAAGVVLPPTPACDDDGGPTPAQTQGPFYTPGTPQRTNLRDPDVRGTPLTIEGRVLSTDCRPIARAVLDVWSCDGEGVYDNSGFRLRGHQFTDAEGRFRIDTVKPADYWQFGIHRTPHIHVKVQGRDTPLLTTQLYFPGEPLNARDAIFNDALVIDLDPPDGTVLHGRFDFVLAARA
jgi:protocatechuate 3,4-dioxygenase beta subunit